MHWNGRFYRLDRGAKLAGVCGGLAECLDVNPNVIRIVWIIVTICLFGVGLVAYLVAALLLPTKSQVFHDL